MSSSKDEDTLSSLILVGVLSFFVPGSGAFLGGVLGSIFGEGKKAVYQGALVGLAFSEMMGCNGAEKKVALNDVSAGSAFNAQAQAYAAPSAPVAASFVSAQRKMMPSV